MFELNTELLESVSGGWGRSRSSGNYTKTTMSRKTNYSKVIANGNFIYKGGSMTVIVTQNIGDNNFGEGSIPA